ncbi:MAG: glycosyltransferase, partial [Nitrososphaeria archaeon]|nr:glycosyltransferase [Nitrososphaeria archaeon]
PSFSLIVPVKDEEDVAARILDRLMEADYPSDRYEVIVVDDASSDDTPKICKRFERLYADRIRYLSRDASFGKPSALNYGLKYAEGDIVGVLDADNVPEKDFLWRTARYFADKNVVGVQGLLSSINAEENLLTKFLHYEGVLHFDALFSGREKLGLFV